MVMSSTQNQLFQKLLVTTNINVRFGYLFYLVFIYLKNLFIWYLFILNSFETKMYLFWDNNDHFTFYNTVIVNFKHFAIKLVYRS